MSVNATVECKEDIKAALIKAQVEKIGMLLKEKEWLLEKICSYSAYFLPKDIDKYMQQALKEG